jgi:ankyrin repeat protein
MSIPQAWGATALYFAAQNNQPKMVRMLLARDANPNGCVGALKKHPLIVAAKQGW